MKIIRPEDLYFRNYILRVENAFRQYWIKKDLFSCIGKPKIKDMFLYLDGMKAEYTMKTGEKIFADDGSLIYIPFGSEYSTRFYDIKSESSNSVAIRFLFEDEDGEPFIMSDKVEVFDSLECSSIIKSVVIAGESVPVCYGELKAGVYSLMSMVGKGNRFGEGGAFSVIEKGVSYMDENFERNFSIKEVADLCNVSEVYFRSLFKEYSGYSPTEYRIRKRIEKAKNYLAYSRLNINEIAMALGYTDTSYFIKQFRSRVGISPNEYRNYH